MTKRAEVEKFINDNCEEIMVKINVLPKNNLSKFRTLVGIGETLDCAINDALSEIYVSLKDESILDRIGPDLTGPDQA
jgi:hypothetical protein